MAIPLRPVESVTPISQPVAPHRRVADVIVETLIELGITTFYGIPGGAIASVYDALVDHPSLKIINTRHETGAAFMAMGHARVSGNIACVLMTSGPGVTNALTGLAAAHADGIPVIAIGGEVPRKNFGRGALQEGSRYQLDLLGMVRSVTKFSAEVSNPSAASTFYLCPWTSRANGLCRSGRRPTCPPTSRSTTKCSLKWRRLFNNLSAA